MGWRQKRTVRQVEERDAMADKLREVALSLAAQFSPPVEGPPTDQELQERFLERKGVTYVKPSHFLFLLAYVARGEGGVITELEVDGERVPWEQLANDWGGDPDFQELVRRRAVQIQAQAAFIEASAILLLSEVKEMAPKNAKLVLALAKPNDGTWQGRLAESALTHASELML